MLTQCDERGVMREMRWKRVGDPRGTGHYPIGTSLSVHITSLSVHTQLHTAFKLAKMTLPTTHYSKPLRIDF